MKREPVTFTLKDDPQVYTLQYDFNALCDHEAAAGVNLMHAIAGGNISAAQTRGLLYAFLKKVHPDVLLSEAGDLLNRDMNTTLGALTKVIQSARGDGDEVSAEPELEEQHA